MADQTIWKYPVSMGSFIHAIPKGAEILCVQIQNGTPEMWALVDPNAEIERREFTIIGTGCPSQPLSKSQYIGTFQEPPFVWHLFEKV